MSSLPLPSPLQPDPDDVRHVRNLYSIGERDWQQLVNDEWRRVCSMVKPERTTPGNVPRSFHMLPVFRAHALNSPSAKRREAANCARADIMEAHYRDDE